MTKTKAKTVTVGRDDLLAAWAVLENLTVSLDQIGGAYGMDPKSRNGAAIERAFQQALAAYVRPELVRAIRDARERLGQYLSDAETERTTERIAYWDYETKRTRGKPKRRPVPSSDRG